MTSLRHACAGILVAASICGSALAMAQPSRTGGQSPSVSPDGQHIVFEADRGTDTQIFVIGIDGKHEAQLTTGKADRSRPQWSTNGRRVMYAEFANDTSRLFAVGLDGTGRKQIAVVPGRNPTLLRDEKAVMYSTGGWATMQLMVSGLDGFNARRISDGTSAVWNPALSPDGKQIAYTRAVRGEPASVWIMNVDGTGAHAATHFSPSDGGAQVPSWSPDGRRLAVQAAVRSPGDSSRRIGHVWIVDLASGQATTLAPHSEPWLDEVPEWFPDGKRLAFQSNRTGRMEIWLMNVDGSGARAVTHARAQSVRPHDSLPGKHSAGSRARRRQY